MSLKRIELATPIGEPLEGSMVELDSDATYLFRVPEKDLDRWHDELLRILDISYKGAPTPKFIIMPDNTELYELIPSDGD